MLTGDFHRLAQLRSDLARIAAGGAMGVLAAQLRDEVHQLAIDCFRLERDPYGRAWAPRKSKQPGPILDRSGTMLNAIRARATSTGVVLTTVGYAAYHEAGTARMPARRFVPDPEMGLGPIWGTAIGRVSDRVVRGLLRAA